MPTNIAMTGEVTASPKGNTGTSGAIHRSKCDQVVEADRLDKILGIVGWDGIVYGLMDLGQGEGGILPVEKIALPGTGRLKLTGSFNFE